MLEVLKLAIALYLVLTGGWVLYITYASLAFHWPTMTKWKWALAPWLLFGLALDVVMNATLFTIVFADLPREWTLTQRLTRYRAFHDGSWRQRVADYICPNILDIFQSGHC